MKAITLHRDQVRYILMLACLRTFAYMLGFKWEVPAREQGTNRPIYLDVQVRRNICHCHLVRENIKPASIRFRLP